jgi:hypothetical protein
MHDIGPASATPVVGVKLLAVWDDSARPAQLSHPVYGGAESAPEGIRTPNLLIRSQMLYPLSYGRMCSIVLDRRVSRRGGERI